MLESVKRSAASSSPVLIEGETGTGKELLARAVHELSPRSGGKFIPFNCGTSTPEVFDAEISGHVRGAFTGAHGARAGLARSADGGTLFLDEVAELTPAIQPRLLRLLDMGEVRPVGSDEILRADVRVIAATHQDMDSAVQSGRFRADLFYRLCTFRVRLPALRERLDDLPILIEHFADQARATGYPSFAGVGTTVVGKMARYGWPGNLRELRNEIFRLAQQAGPGEKARHWRSPESPPTSPKGEAEAPYLWERDKLIAELRSARGSVATVARRLGISRARVYRLISTWNLDLESFRQ
jgi:DNA-binding NtrC family response regulator